MLAAAAIDRRMGRGLECGRAVDGSTADAVVWLQRVGEPYATTAALFHRTLYPEARPGYIVFAAVIKHGSREPLWETQRGSQGESTLTVLYGVIA